jgi:hypothetical protein
MLARDSRELVATARAIYAAGAVTRRPSPETASSPPRFSAAGVVRTWDPARRELEIGARRLTVAPGVAITRMARAAHILLSGYLPGDGALGIVTRLTVR